MSASIPDRTFVEQVLLEQGIEDVAVFCFAQLGSTNHWLRKQITSGSAQHDQQTSLCVTDWQQAGIGRRGKSWQTLPGNITFSIYRASMREPQELMGLSLASGIAIAQVMRREYALDICLKWPNDLIFGGAKIGGLLTEIVGPSGSGVITGIGVNVVHDPQIATLSIGTTSLEAAGVKLAGMGRDGLIGKIAAEVLLLHEQFDEQGWAPFMDQWNALDWLAGKNVLVHGNTVTEHAVARGVDHEGALLIEQGGEVKPIYGGNVSIRPAP
ncbi:MAG: biotin--[acetyl-CoA-carboxylase] ligase [Granulosicoccus sp.]